MAVKFLQFCPTIKIKKCKQVGGSRSITKRTSPSGWDFVWCLRRPDDGTKAFSVTGFPIASYFWEDETSAEELQMFRLAPLPQSCISVCLNSHGALTDANYARLSQISLGSYLLSSLDLSLLYLFLKRV